MFDLDIHTEDNLGKRRKGKKRKKISKNKINRFQTVVSSN